MDSQQAETNGIMQRIEQRVKVAREAQGLSKSDLARQVCSNSPQTISFLEGRSHNLTANELLVVAEKLGKPLEYFTDPFLLVGEGKFSWRQKNVSEAELRAYEEKAGRWIAAFCYLAPQVVEEHNKNPKTHTKLDLSKKSQYENARSAGERMAADWNLGDCPARELVNQIEQKTDILVLMVDASEGISGAACHLPQLDTILIERNEVPWRRHFDLAHELFHVLTWQTMPPEYSEDNDSSGGNRVEQLANEFAAGLLIPPNALQRFYDKKHLRGWDLAAELNQIANELQVSAESLQWRLVNRGDLSLEAVKTLPEQALRYNGHIGRENIPDERPRLFSSRFIRVMKQALDKGLISAGRLASLLDLNFDNLNDLFLQYDIDGKIEL